MLAGALFAIASLAIARWWLGERLSHEREVNAFVQRETVKLRRDVEEVLPLREHVALILERHEIRRTIIAGRPLVAEAVADLSRLPRGIVLDRVVVREGRLNAFGTAASEAALAGAQSAMAASPFLLEAKLAPLDAAAGAARRFRLEAGIATPGRVGSRAEPK